MLFVLALTGLQVPLYKMPLDLVRQGAFAFH
jgi:hypothetical protein